MMTTTKIATFATTLALLTFAATAAHADPLNTTADAGITYVLIEVQNAGSEGATIDAVSITTPDGAEHYAHRVEDFYSDQPFNPKAIPGAPDGTCAPRDAIAPGGYVIVTFAPEHARALARGATITVYSAEPCGAKAAQRSLYKVSVSDDGTVFAEIGRSSAGMGQFTLR